MTFDLNSNIQLHVLLAGVVIMLVQRLKNSQSPIAKWVNPETARKWSIFAAAAVQAGFVFSHTGSVLDGGSITLQFPSLQTMIQFFIGTATQGMMQEAGYRATIGIGDLGRALADLQGQIAAMSPKRDEEPPWPGSRRDIEQGDSKIVLTGDPLNVGKVIDPTKTGHLE